MFNEIQFTSVFNDSILTKIKVGYQYQSVITKALDFENQKFISQTRLINSQLNQMIVSEVAASDIPSALFNHIALVNAGLGNKTQPLATQPLSTFDANLVLTDESNAKSLNIPFTHTMLAANIGYDAPKKSPRQRRSLSSLSLAAVFGLLLCNYIMIFYAA
jgi:L-cysteine desulfidase